MNFKLLTVATLLCCSLIGAVSAQQATLNPDTSKVPAHIEAKFLHCQHEAFQSYFLGMGYFQAKQRGEELEAYDDSKETKQRLKRIRKGDKSGEFKHYADFAATALYDCAREEGLAVEKSLDIARVCFARVDIPFYLLIAKNNGVDKAVAINQVSQALNDANLHPRPLIELVADMVYSNPNSQDLEIEIMRAVFWTCYGRAKLDTDGALEK